MDPAISRRELLAGMGASALFLPKAAPAFPAAAAPPRRAGGRGTSLLLPPVPVYAGIELFRKPG